MCVISHPFRHHYYQSHYNCIISGSTTLADRKSDSDKYLGIRQALWRPPVRNNFSGSQTIRYWDHHQYHRRLLLLLLLLLLHLS